MDPSKNVSSSKVATVTASVMAVTPPRKKLFLLEWPNKTTKATLITPLYEWLFLSEKPKEL